MVEKKKIRKREGERDGTRRKIFTLSLLGV